MRSTKIIQTAKAGYIGLSAVLCGLGIALMANPGMSVALIGDIVGAVLIAKDLYRLAFQFDLAFGALLIALGLTLIIRSGSAMNVLCIILGIEIVADGLFKVQTAMDARRFGLGTWWLILAMAIVAGAVGIALIFWPSQSALVLVRLLGLSLALEGVMNLAVGLCAIKIVAHQQPDAVENRIYQ